MKRMIFGLLLAATAVSTSGSMGRTPTDLSRAIVGADSFAWKSIGAGWERVTWNKESGVLRGNGRPVFFEDDAMPPGLGPAAEGNLKGMLPDSQPRTAGSVGLYVNVDRDGFWEIYAEAVFALAERGTRRIGIAVWKVGSFRWIALSPAEPANQTSQHIISVSGGARIGIDEVIFVYVRAHDNGAPVNDFPWCPGCGVGVKGTVFAVWAER